jgi:hypothetical protein
MGGSIYAWEDGRSGQPDIYCHHIYPNGFNVGIDEGNYLAEANLFPNPFSTELNLNYTLVQEENISIHIHDISGRELKSFSTSEIKQNPGSHTVKIQFDPTENANGFYFITLNGKSFTKTYKVLRHDN